ncbi:MAG: TetR/AcrR family transcriptional regulator [Lachnospiraceae bacterium]|nr:TetR/AcrR family transcriptional regulator [Lachnospiraceae bacterium]
METRERKTDLRVVKTREAIQNTFKEMVCEMDAQDITIRELADRARIHRKTFYLHYTSIEALYADVLNGTIQELKEEMNQIPVPLDPHKVVRIAMEFLVKQDTYFERLICNSSYRDFGNKLFACTCHFNTILEIWI